MGDVCVDVKVNGTRHTRTVPARISLADFLRDCLGLTGTHLGCEHGACGACTVLLDDRTARSCIVLAAQSHGRAVRTVEGVGGPTGQSTIQDALARHHGLQCGFCTPGFVMSAVELLESGEPLDEAQVREALSGNVCRCTGYQGIVSAILEVASDGGS